MRCRCPDAFQVCPIPSSFLSDDECVCLRSPFCFPPICLRSPFCFPPICLPPFFLCGSAHTYLMMDDVERVSKIICTLSLVVHMRYVTPRVVLYFFPFSNKNETFHTPRFTPQFTTHFTVADNPTRYVMCPSVGPLFQRKALTDLNRAIALAAESGDVVTLRQVVRLCVCVCARERERQRERQRETETETERERDRDSEREAQRERETGATRLRRGVPVQNA